MTSRYDSALDFAAHYWGPQGAGYWWSLMRGIERGTITPEQAFAAWTRDRGDELPPELEEEE